MIKKYGIWLLIFIFGCVYSLYSITRHLRFDSFIFDLGVYDQIIWLFGHGKPFFSSILEAHPWGDHFTPTILLLAPLYWIWDNVIILLLFQAFFTAFGAYPIYLLAKKKIKDYRLALVIAFVYLSFYGIQNMIAFDFHPIALATTLLAWLFWLYEEKKWPCFWLILLLFWGLQENFFLLSAAFGAFLILRYRDFKRGALISSLSIVFFVLLILVIIPRLGQAPFTYLPTHLKSLTPLGAVKMFFYPYSKVRVMAASFLSFGFLPLFTPASLIMLLEEFLQRFVGSPISTRWNLGFQYNAILAPVLAFAAIEAIQKKFLKKKIIAVCLLLGGTLLVQAFTSPAFNMLHKKEFYDFTKNKDSRAILALIPPTASVATTNNLGAQIAHREKLIFLANCHDNPQPWLIDTRRCYKLKPEYLVADLNPANSPVYLFPDISRESILKYFDYLQKSGEYILFKKQNDVWLLKRTSND